jgi:hypothetical protein
LLPPSSGRSSPSKHLWNVGKLPDYTVQQPRKHPSSNSTVGYLLIGKDGPTCLNLSDLSSLIQQHFQAEEVLWYFDLIVVIVEKVFYKGMLCQEVTINRRLVFGRRFHHACFHTFWC